VISSQAFYGENLDDFPIFSAILDYAARIAANCAFLAMVASEY